MNSKVRLLFAIVLLSIAIVDGQNWVMIGWTFDVRFQYQYQPTWLNGVKDYWPTCQSDGWNIITISHANVSPLVNCVARQSQRCHQWCTAFVQTSRNHAIKVYHKPTELTRCCWCIWNDLTPRVTRRKWCCCNTHIYKTILRWFVRGFLWCYQFLAPTTIRRNTF